jgi:hypothetical protein
MSTVPDLDAIAARILAAADAEIAANGLPATAVSLLLTRVLIDAVDRHQTLDAVPSLLIELAYGCLGLRVDGDHIVAEAKSMSCCVGTAPRVH